MSRLQVFSGHWIAIILVAVGDRSWIGCRSAVVLPQAQLGIEQGSCHSDDHNSINDW